MTNFKTKVKFYIHKIVTDLQKFADRKWYPILIGLLAALDNFIIIVPTDGILISSAMLTPKRWITLAFSVAIGSTLGALLLALFVETQGLQLINEFYPHLDSSSSWIMTRDFFSQYGLVVVFIVAVTPLMQQPSVILASLADTPLTHLALVIFIGRFLKFLLFTYLGVHAPQLFNKIWSSRNKL